MDLEYFKNNQEQIANVETISGQGLYDVIYQGTGMVQDTRFLPVEQGGVFKDLDLRELTNNKLTTFYPNIQVSGKIVALVQLEKDPGNENTFWKSFVNVDPEFQERGYATKVLEETFRFAKEKNMHLVNSSYNAEGELKLQKKNLEFAEKYQVPFIDGKRRF